MPLPRTPAFRIGDTIEVGFVFRNKTGTLASPSGVTVEIRDRAGGLEVIDETDPRVTIGATLGVALAADLDLTTDENTAGTGIVAVQVTPDTDGRWTIYCAGDGGGAETKTVYVIDKHD